MWIPWGLLPGAVALSLLGAAATAFRSALLILGEEGLSEAASAGDGAARRLLVAVRDPALGHPFSLWAGASALKVGSALCAGGGGLVLFLALPGWTGTAACAAWLFAYLLLLFVLENAATLGVIGNPRRVLRWSRLCRLALGAAAPAARLFERAGRLLVGPGFASEALMDIRFGSEEGILDVIEEGAEHGTIDPTEEKIIERVLRFSEMTVAGVMTPWAEVVTLGEGMSRDEAAARVREAGFSRYPVLSRGGEELMGIVATRDLLSRPADGEPDRFPGSARLEKPVYVPQSMKVSDLLRQFQRTRVHLAVSIDEHGKLCGVVTVHDLLERIVGRIAEGAEDQELPEWEKDGALSVPASIPVRVLRDEYGIDIPLGTAYETAGGFALDCLQSVPEGVVTFLAHGYRITVAETEGFRIRRLRFERTVPTGTS